MLKIAGQMVFSLRDVKDTKWNTSLGKMSS